MAKTLVTFVLDETGSMQSIKDDTIGGFNSYLETLKAGKGEIRFSLVKFDSNKIERVCVDLPVKEVKPLSGETYQPGAATPLIDVCYKSIKATEEKAKKKDNVAIVIQTDGLENASTEYTSSDLTALVKEKTEAGWSFTFIGAGIDAFSQAGKFGIAAASTMTYDRDKSAQAFAASARGTMAYAASGMAESAEFTQEERATTGGHMPDLTNVTAAAKRKSRSPRKAVDDFTL